MCVKTFNPVVYLFSRHEYLEELCSSPDYYLQGVSGIDSSGGGVPMRCYSVFLTLEDIHCNVPCHMQSLIAVAQNKRQESLNLQNSTSLARMGIRYKLL